MAISNECAGLFESYAQTYRFLSQAFFKELTEEAIDELSRAQWPRDTGNATLDEGYALMRRYFAFGVPDRRTQLAVEYARIFLAAGVFSKEKRTAIPYESVFTSEEHTMMGASRDDVVRQFREDGFAVAPSLYEPEDHLSFELEYLQMMCVHAAEFAKAQDADKLACAIRRQVSFITSHLLNWVPLLADIADDYATLTFYPGMLKVCIGTLEQACGIMPELLAEIEGR